MAAKTLPALPDVVRSEIDRFAERSQAYKAGQVPDEEFKPYRLTHGIYGQRQPDVQMVRIKIPGGRMSAAQARTLSEATRDYSPRGLAHLTTRQAVQIHFVELGRVPELMERLAWADLTTREACGNAIRNITCSPVSGLAADEVFDTYPYAQAAFRHFLRRPEFANLPRKFKMSFNGSERDLSQTAINDIGATAQVRIVDGRPQRGFRVRFGGGLGASPQNAWLWSDFTPEDEVLPLITAILLHFNEKGERKNRMAARLKYLVRKEGEEAFRAEVGRILATLPKSIPFELEASEEPTAEDPAATPPVEGAEGYPAWLRLNTWPQKQPGLRYAIVKVPLGDLTWGQVAALADLSERLGRAELRTANDQNLVIPHVPAGRLAELHSALKDLGLAEPGPDLIGDVTSCPGSDTCNLAFVSSKGLAARLTELLAFRGEGSDDLRGTHIKISGCPNSCGQHHIGTFGFFGHIRKVNGKDSPHFQVLIGGGLDATGATFGRLVGRIPSRRAPQLVEAFIAKFRAERAPGQGLEAWLRALPLEAARKVLEPFSDVVREDEELFKDNGSEEVFAFTGLGASECA